MMVIMNAKYKSYSIFKINVKHLKKVILYLNAYIHPRVIQDKKFEIEFVENSWYS